MRLVNELLQMMRGRYVANTAWLLAERVIRLGSTLLIAAMLARHLEPAGFGFYSYVVSFVALFGALITLGLDGVLIRDIVNRGELLERSGTVLSLRLMGAVIAALLAGGTAFATGAAQDQILAISLLSCSLILQTMSVAELAFQAKVSAKYGSASRLLQQLFSLTTKATAVAMDATVMVFVALLVLDALFLAAAYSVAFRKRFKAWLIPRWEKRYVKELLVAAKTLLITDLLVSVNSRIDQVMIEHLAGVQEVGIYAAASVLSEAWYFFPMVVSASVFPMLIDSYRENAAKFQRQLQSLTNLLVMVALVVAIATTWLSDWVIFIVYGEGYAQSAIILSIHIWAGVFISAGLSTGKALLNDANYPAIYIRAAVTLLLNVTLNSLLIPQYGGVGAAWSLLAACLGGHILADLIVPSSRYLVRIKFRSLLLIDRSLDFDR